MLPKEAVEEFQTIWRKQFGEEISYVDAEIRGIELIELFQLIAPKEEDFIKKKSEEKPDSKSIEELA